jgi:predicted secreted protein
MIAHSVRTTLLGTALLAAGLFSCAAAARADTVLNLTVTADVTVMPDELVAQLTAQADAPSAGDAQAQVNAMIAKALEAAKPLQAVTASTTTYSVWHQTDPKDVWHASQGMALRSHDGAGLLTLIGQLQTEGLAVGDLSWQLSPALAEKSDEQAMAKAIGKLTERARGAASAYADPWLPARDDRRWGRARPAADDAHDGSGGAGRRPAAKRPGGCRDGLRHRLRHRAA